MSKVLVVDTNTVKGNFTKEGLIEEMKKDTTLFNRLSNSVVYRQEGELVISTAYWYHWADTSKVKDLPKPLPMFFSPEELAELERLYADED